ncbi:MAG: hypothetical protein U5R31_02595 [Acidimicrobiia bacterium]|nr:hypothetical protein [Acidimicrobiia bacterium]
MNWSYGTLVTPRTPDEVEGEGIAELLDEAEDIVNAAGPDIVAELESEKANKGRLKKLRRKMQRKKKRR